MFGLSILAGEQQYLSFFMILFGGNYGCIAASMMYCSRPKHLVGLHWQLDKDEEVCFTLLCIVQLYYLDPEPSRSKMMAEMYLTTHMVDLWPT